MASLDRVQVRWVLRRTLRATTLRLDVVNEAQAVHKSNGFGDPMAKTRCVSREPRRWY